MTTSPIVCVGAIVCRIEIRTRSDIVGHARCIATTGFDILYRYTTNGHIRVDFSHNSLIGGLRAARTVSCKACAVGMIDITYIGAYQKWSTSFSNVRGCSCTRMLIFFTLECIMWMFVISHCEAGRAVGLRFMLPRPFGGWTPSRDRWIGKNTTCVGVCARKPLQIVRLTASSPTARTHTGIPTICVKRQRHAQHAFSCREKCCGQPKFV